MERIGNYYLLSSENQYTIFQHSFRDERISPLKDEKYLLWIYTPKYKRELWCRVISKNELLHR